MTTLSTLLANKAGPLRVTVAGEARDVAYLSQTTKAQFERWLKMNAQNAIIEAREYMPPDVWADAYRVVSQDLAGKAYSFHGAVAQAALRNAAGALYLASLLFGLPEAEMIALMERDPVGVKAALDVALAESAPAPAPNA